MKKAQRTPPDLGELRQQAEQGLPAQGPSAAQPRADLDARALVHELEVHQIELEMQNEALHHAQIQAEQASAKYSQLFDLAPVGYFVLDPHGLIREANLAAAALLGLDRQGVTGRQFEHFVTPDSRAAFGEMARTVWMDEGRCSCEVRLLQHRHEPRDFLIEGTVPEGGPAQGRGCLLAVTDITERKRVQEQLLLLNTDLERRVAERTAELRRSNAELTHYNRAMVGRELRMVELKKEINELCRQAGQPPRYPNYATQEEAVPEGSNPRASDAWRTAGVPRQPL